MHDSAMSNVTPIGFSARTPLYDAPNSAIDAVVESAAGRRDEILSELGEIRREERVAQRALIEIQRETLVQAESTISLLREQIRLIEARISNASLLPSPPSLHGLIALGRSSPGSGTSTPALNSPLNISLPPSYTSQTASQRLQALAAGLMRTAPAFHTIGAPPVVVPVKEENDDDDSADDSYAEDESDSEDDEKPSITHVETVPLPKLKKEKVKMNTREDSRLRKFRQQLETGLRDFDGERMKPQVVVVRLERYGR